LAVDPARFPAVALQHPGPNFLQYLRYAPLARPQTNK